MELCNKFFGPKDVIFHESTLGESPFKAKKVVETRTHTFVCENEARKTMTIDYQGKNKGITNFKIGPASSLEFFELEFGGQDFSKYQLFKDLKCEVKVPLICDNNVLPTLKEQEIRIFFQTTQSSIITVSYDIVELTIDMADKAEYLIVTKSERDIWPHKFNNSTLNEISLNSIGLPIRYIYAFLPDDVEDARLILDNVDHNLVLTNKDNYHVYDFGENVSLNVFAVKDIKLVVKTKTSHLNFGANVHVICKKLLILKNEWANVVFRG